MLQGSGESVNLDVSYIVYGKDGLLPSNLLYRILSTFSNRRISITSVYEFLYFSLNYNDIDNFLFIGGDKREIFEVQQEARVLNSKPQIVTCAETKPFGIETILVRLNCSIDMSVFLIREALLRVEENVRTKRLLEEINEYNVEDSEPFPLDNIECVALSPVMYPAYEILTKTHKFVKTYHYPYHKMCSGNTVVVYNGVDEHIGRMMSSDISLNGNKVSIKYYNYDPILAPLYLTAEIERGKEMVKGD
ncbi:hypothetical protein HS7_16820 [Sulfolobales archaeon HS-7]|nr:hypothetical protein HS7_16820 [Sulfolobales archaeon HS-7]